jgi:hypothetical protein
MFPGLGQDFGGQKFKDDRRMGIFVMTRLLKTEDIGFW